ncbi:MAG: hypothetical protein ACRYG7_03790 [Janthinobacterium lividum]
MALVVPVGLRAQQVPASTTSPTPAGQANSSRALMYRAATPEQRATRMSQEISRELSLDAATTAKVQAAALARCQKIDAIQQGTTSNKEKNQALEANAKDFKAALQGILTPAQYAQYASKSDKQKKAPTSQSTPAPAN